MIILRTYLQRAKRLLNIYERQNNSTNWDSLINDPNTISIFRFLILEFKNILELISTNVSAISLDNCYSKFHLDFVLCDVFFSQFIIILICC